MAQQRVIYNCQALFAGPALTGATGYNFISYTGGIPTNDYSNLYQQLNLLHSIDRIQSVNYSIDVPHVDINQLGTRGLIDRPIVNPPSVNLNFAYYLCGTKNEARLGLNVNYPQFDGTLNGTSFYSDNLNVSLLSGFFENDKKARIKRVGQNFFVNQYRDCRNFYVVVNQEGDDINKEYFKENFTQADIYQGIDDNAPDYHVISFGNCYLNSYAVQGQVGGFASASVSYVAYNINFDMSGSGFIAPDIETKKGALNNESSVVIPRVLAEEGYSALKAGDISITTDSFSGLGVDFNKLHLQSYGIGMELNREPLDNLGYKFPVDLRASAPIMANLELNGVVESGTSGSLIDLININGGYDFTIKVNPTTDCPQSLASPINGGAIPIRRGDEALRYSFVGAKLNDFGYVSDIGDNKIFNASFSVEVDPDDRGRGFFISGDLVEEKVEDFVLLEGGSDDRFYLQQETKDLLTTNLFPLY